MNHEKELIEMLKNLNPDDVEGLRNIMEHEYIMSLEIWEMMNVFDKALDFVDMSLDLSQQQLNPNIEVNKLLNLMFIDNDETEQYEISLDLEIKFHAFRNKTKFLYMVAFSDHPFNQSVFEFFGNYLNAECDTGILTVFIIRSLKMNKIPSNIYQFWLRNQRRFFYHDPSCKTYYTSMDDTDYRVDSASNLLLGVFNKNTFDLQYAKHLYPSAGQIITLGAKYSEDYEFDVWVSKHWSKKFIIYYFNGFSYEFSLFAHIPNRKIYDLLLEDERVSGRTKDKLKKLYEEKQAGIESFTRIMSKIFDQANHSIPDILPDEVKKIILEKTIKASFAQWRHSACTFHGDEEGESVKTFDTILDNIFSSPKKDPNASKKRTARQSGFKDDKGKTKWVKTKSEPRSFTAEQKKVIKKLAKKYKNAFDELKLP